MICESPEEAYLYSVMVISVILNKLKNAQAIERQKYRLVEMDYNLLILKQLNLIL
jgi:hypothetical protein